MLLLEQLLKHAHKYEVWELVTANLSHETYSVNYYIFILAPNFDLINQFLVLSKLFDEKAH
jgi:hypothetical protein